MNQNKSPASNQWSPHLCSPCAASHNGDQSSGPSGGLSESLQSCEIDPLITPLDQMVLKVILHIISYALSCCGPIKVWCKKNKTPACQSMNPESLLKLVALSIYIMTSYIVTQRNLGRKLPWSSNLCLSTGHNYVLVCLWTPCLILIRPLDLIGHFYRGIFFSQSQLLRRLLTFIKTKKIHV